MKNLLLIRHGKSSWRDTALSDFERPLNKRGKRDAPVMGVRLLELGLRPELIVSSPAKRALKTAKLIAATLEYPKKRIEVLGALYQADVAALLAIVAGLDAAYSRVLLVGHNPELTALAHHLSGAVLENVPTCGLVSVEFAVDTWPACTTTQGRLARFERPPKPAAAVGRADG